VIASAGGWVFIVKTSRVLPAGMAFVARGLVLCAQLPVHGHYFWNLLPAFLLSGLGLAFAFVPVSIGALTGVSGDEAGVASGLVNTSQQIGGAIGLAVVTTIATTFRNRYVDAHVGTSPLGGAALTHGFQVTFYVLAVIAGNAFEAAAASSREAELEAELDDLFKGQNESRSKDATSIPATFLRVRVAV
jgi:MFS family permease